MQPPLPPPVPARPRRAAPGPGYPILTPAAARSRAPLPIPNRYGIVGPAPETRPRSAPVTSAAAATAASPAPARAARPLSAHIITSASGPARAARRARPPVTVAPPRWGVSCDARVLARWPRMRKWRALPEGPRRDGVAVAGRRWGTRDREVRAPRSSLAPLCGKGWGCAQARRREAGSSRGGRAPPLPFSRGRAP